jgi:hypothetical protein
MRHINPLLACDIAEEVLRTPEMTTFKGKIENFISNRKDKHSSTKVSVYFRELNNGLWFSIGVTVYNSASRSDGEFLT